MNNSKSNEEGYFNYLNVYSHHPTTIPPFALEKEYSRNNNGYINNVDNFDNDKYYIKNYNTKKSFTMNHNLKLNNLPILDSEWGGEERLKNIFNLTDVENMNFDNFEDRRRWSEFVRKMKKHYHTKPKKSYSNNNFNNNNYGTSYSNNSIICKEWIKEEIDKEKEHWIGFKNQRLKQYKPILKDFILNNIIIRLALRIIIIILCISVIIISSNIIAGERNNALMGIENIVSNSDNFNTKTINLFINFSDLMFNISSNIFAIIYNIYIAYDEFSGKPIGLNDPTTYIIIVMLDLLFIIIENVNLSLSMNYIINTRSFLNKETQKNYVNIKTELIVRTFCQQEQSLIIITFLLELIWILTFCICILKTINKSNSIYSNTYNNRYAQYPLHYQPH